MLVKCKKCVYNTQIFTRYPWVFQGVNNRQILYHQYDIFYQDNAFKNKLSTSETVVY
jgi:hypothetical protein